jgi:hypothetical protein
VLACVERQSVTELLDVNLDMVGLRQLIRLFLTPPHTVHVLTHASIATFQTLRPWFVVTVLVAEADGQHRVCE